MAYQPIPAILDYACTKVMLNFKNVVLIVMSLAGCLYPGLSAHGGHSGLCLHQGASSVHALPILAVLPIPLLTFLIFSSSERVNNWQACHSAVSVKHCVM